MSEPGRTTCTHAAVAARTAPRRLAGGSTVSAGSWAALATVTAHVCPLEVGCVPRCPPVVPTVPAYGSVGGTVSLS